MFYGNINNEFFDKQCNLMPKPLALCLKYLKENDMAKAEADVQFLASGGPEEAAFWSDDCSLEVDENLLSTKRDILFYKNSDTIKEGRIYLTPGTYACYFPWDVHVPAIQVGKEEKPIRKIVIKVPLEDCYR